MSKSLHLVRLLWRAAKFTSPFLAAILIAGATKYLFPAPADEGTQTITVTTTVTKTTP